MYDGKRYKVSPARAILSWLTFMLSCNAASVNHELPCMHVSDGNLPDNMGAYRVFPDKRYVIVTDRGYVDSELWYD